MFLKDLYCPEIWNLHIFGVFFVVDVVIFFKLR